MHGFDHWITWICSVCPGIDWCRATPARLSCCKSSPDIQAHGDLQYGVAVIDDGVCGSSVSGAEGLTGILLITPMSCVGVCVSVYTCMFVMQISVDSSVLSAVYLTKCCV